MKITKKYIGTDDKETIIGGKRIGRVVYPDNRVMIYCGSVKNYGFSDSSYLWVETKDYQSVMSAIKEIASQMDDSESEYKGEFGDSYISIRGDSIYYYSPRNIHCITIPKHILSEAINFLISSGPR